MKKSIFLFLFIGLLTFSFSQIDESLDMVPTIGFPDKEPDSNAVFVVVEQSPEFPEGDEARMRFLQKNIKYPRSAQEERRQGVVYATFVIEKDGSLSDIKILRGLSLDLDAEVIRVIKLFPKWIPGKQRGKVVRVQYSMPFRFVLSE